MARGKVGTKIKCQYKRCKINREHCNRLHWVHFLLISLCSLLLFCSDQQLVPVNRHYYSRRTVRPLACVQALSRGSGAPGGERACTQAIRPFTDFLNLSNHKSTKQN